MKWKMASRDFVSDRWFLSGFHMEAVHGVPGLASGQQRGLEEEFGRLPPVPALANNLKSRRANGDETRNAPESIHSPVREETCNSHESKPIHREPTRNAARPTPRWETEEPIDVQQRRAGLAEDYLSLWRMRIDRARSLGRNQGNQENMRLRECILLKF